jgi:AraC-like DNA-binding protein
VTVQAGVQYRLHDAVVAERSFPHRQPWRRLPFVLIEQVERGAYVLRRHGRADLVVEGGAAFVVPPRMGHHLAVPPAVSCSLRWLHADFTLDSGNDLFSCLTDPLVTGADLGREVGQIIGRLASGWDPRPDVRLRKTIAQHELLARLAGLFLDRCPALREAATDLARTKMAPVLTFIRENLDQRITRAMLARLVGLSPTRFHYVFEAEIGRSPMGYVRAIRLQKAKQLLIQTALGIQEIAERVGFGDAYYFSRVFKKTQGVTPSGYRREMKG